jgi:hypothetical protein
MLLTDAEIDAIWARLTSTDPHSTDGSREIARDIEAAIVAKLKPVQWMLDPNGDIFTEKFDRNWEKCQRLYVLPSEPT